VLHPLYDPTGVTAEVRAAALAIGAEPFLAALGPNRLGLWALVGKFANAWEAGEQAVMRDVGWRYAHAAAMRIALLERTPYESGRTLWAEAGRRGYQMRALVENLTDQSVAEQAACMRAVWDAFQLEPDPWETIQ